MYVCTELFYNGESHSVEQPHSYTCPLCGEVGLSENDLRDHVTRTHTDSSSNVQEVVSSAMCLTLKTHVLNVI